MDDTDLHSDRQEGRQAAGLWWTPGLVLCSWPHPPVPTSTPRFCLVNTEVWVNEKGLDHREERQSSPRHLCSPQALWDLLSMTGPPLHVSLPTLALHPLGHTTSSGGPVAAKHSSPSVALDKGRQTKRERLVHINSCEEKENAQERLLFIQKARI